MSNASVLKLVQNAALLITLAVIFNSFTHYIRQTDESKQNYTDIFIRIAGGFLIGIIGIVIMLTPWDLMPGIIFDTRSVLLVVSGLFFGVIPTSIAMLIMAGFRLYLGGAGALTGVLVILVIGTLGIVWRYFNRPTLEKITGIRIYILGLLAHILMLLIMFTLPGKVTLEVLRAISLPVLLIYPLATLIMGLLLRDRLKHLKLQQELARSLILLNNSQQLSKVGGWEWAPADRSMSWTDETYRIHGLNPKTKLPDSRKLLDISNSCFSMEDREKITTAFQTCCTQGQPFDMEFPFTALGGEAKWVRIRAEAIMERGKVTRVLGNFMDITERKNAERVLQELEKKWRNILVETPQLGITLDPEANIVFANKQFLKLTGWKEEEVLGRNWFDLFIPEDIREEIRSVFDQVMCSHDTVGYTTFENDILTASGEHRNIAWSNVITKNMENEVVDIACLGIDLTERNRAEENMRLLSEMLDVAPSAITIHDAHGNFLYANQNCLELHGYSLEEFLSINLHQLDVPESEVLINEQINRIYNEGSVQFETAHFRKDGSILPLEVFAKQVTWQNQPALLSIASNITDRKKAEDELKRRQRLVEAATNISGMLIKNSMPQETLSEVVRVLGEASEQDRAYYFSWNTHSDRSDEVTISLLYEWTRKSVPSIIANPAAQHILISHFPNIYLQLCEGNSVNVFAAELPGRGKEFLEGLGIISIILVPVMINGTPRGLIGFDNCHFNYSWTSGEKNILAIVADNIAGAFVRCEAENTIRSNNETARIILNSVKESVFLMQIDGFVINANHTAAKRLGLEITDLIETNIYNYLPDDLAQLRKHKVDELINIRKPVNFEDERSGLWFENSLYPVFDDAGTITQVSVYGRDITERKLAERQMQTTQQELKQLLIEAKRSRQALLSVVEDQKEAEDQVRLLNTELEQRVKERTVQLEYANKELEAFSYSVSHDLRAPLRALEGFSSILLQDYGNNFDEQVKHYLIRIQEASQRMKQLIDDLLNLSKISRQNIKLSEVDLSQLVEQICNNLELEFSNQYVEKRIASGIVIKADPNLIKIVLENLLHNAFKYSSKKQKSLVEFGVLHQNEERVFFVRDNGAGFDMDYADKLFVPFQRLHGSKEFSGTGIGLTIVQRIITRHGGQVWTEAVLNQGATFYFTIEEK